MTELTKNFVIYDPATGEIVYQQTIAATEPDPVQPGEDYKIF